MSSVRIRPPIDVDPPEFTFEWYQAGGDGVWMVLKNGRVVSCHTWKWQARREARALARAGGVS